MKCFHCLLLIIYLYYAKVDAKKKKGFPEGCNENLTLFGPNDLYTCNCEELRFCDFANNGKCKKQGCKKNFGGPFCQKRLFHYALRNEQEFFKNITSKAQKKFTVDISKVERVNQMKMSCSPQGKSITIEIGGKLFCERNCSKKVICLNDTGKLPDSTELIIRAEEKIRVSNFRMTGCTPFWFGKNCGKQCHCLNNSDCHQSTGHCSLGCEYGRNGPDCQTLNYKNVAVNKTASQTTVYGRSNIFQNGSCNQMDFNFTANLAIDGNIDQHHERLSCIHTECGNQTWTVRLGKEYNISWIRIYNRNDNVERIHYAEVYVDTEKCFVIKDATKIINIKCPKVLLGSTVSIKTNDNFLTFCEVEVLQCHSGFYGDNCNEFCQGCKNSSCNQWSGECEIGCTRGYKEKNKSCTVCPLPTFGQNCSETCHCKDNNNCNKTNGSCRTGGCETGYKGENCQEPCPLPTFGQNCSETCHCKDNNNCNKTNGSCGPGGCVAGYKGENCQELCPLPTFGQNCSETCHCKDNNNCNKTNGSCRTGGCETGYKGENCQELCPLPTFGQKCSETCHCKDNNNCNKRNGSCGPGGCETGYKGENCQEPTLLIPLIIGLSVLLIIAAAIVIIICFVIIKSRGKKQNSSMIISKVSLPEDIEMDPATVEGINEEDDWEPIDDQENIYMNSESLQRKIKGITKNNILSYVQNKKMEELPFAEEFLKLPKGLLYAHDIAKEEKNKSKNRYKTILPYDHSRVCLQPDEHSSSDYINGNYLTVNKRYIATQGPLNSTISDFWRMVYQTQCSIIVMLTNLSENGKVKSEQYWPDLEMTETYGMISVSHIQENKSSYYTYRQFCITKNSKKFWVEHYQFTSWPDHGAPKESEYFIAFRNKVRSTPFYKAPIIVHCSAGVGRSGTYIVLDIILEEMKNNPRIDVMGCIFALRKYRTLIVQNRSQLEYIYDVLAENIFTGSTVICTNELPDVFIELQKFPDKSIVSFMELQFEEFILPVTSTTNNSSRRGAAFMSYDNEQYVADNENDIIDNTTLNGNNLEDEFMLISTPSEENLEEFWRAIFLKRCSLLVMFDNVMSEGAVYWPEEKNSVAEYEHFVVKLVEEKDNDHYIERTLKVSSSKLNMPELLVHQFQFNIWLGTDFPSPKIMVDLIQAVHNFQINQSHKRIALHCLDGSSKNGLFCVLYMIIEILQKDSLISIVQLIRLHKRKKEDIIPDYMSYHYCWLVAKVFLEELSQYGNTTF